MSLERKIVNSVSDYSVVSTKMALVNNIVCCNMVECLYLVDTSIFAIFLNFSGLVWNVPLII